MAVILHIRLLLFIHYYISTTSSDLISLLFDFCFVFLFLVPGDEREGAHASRGKYE